MTTQYVVQLCDLTALERMALDAIRRREFDNAESLVRVKDLLIEVGRDGVMVAASGT